MYGDVPWCHVWVRVKMIVDGEGCCVGTWFGLQWVWLERCRDGRYAVNALHCDVWVV